MSQVRTTLTLDEGVLLLPEKDAPISTVVPSTGREPREVGEIPAVIALSAGDRRVARTVAGERC